MAIVSLIALFAALALAVLIAFQPWSKTPVAPTLALAPGLGVALGDSVALPPTNRLALAPARPAPGAGAGQIGGEPVASRSDFHATAALAPARVAAAPVTAKTPQPAPQAPAPQASPVSAEPAPPPAEQPVAVPVSAPPPATEPVAAEPRTPAGAGEGGPGPRTAGLGEVGGEEEPPATEEEEALEEEEGEATEEEATEEGECAPPLSFFFEGVMHDVALCHTASDEESGFYLMLDGERLEVVLP